MRRFILSTLATLLFILAGTAQPSWPDLTTIKVGVNKTCTVDGAAAPGSEKARLNRLKNRFRLPNGTATPITLNQLLTLNQGHIQGQQIIGFPDSSDANNQRAVTLEGYVLRVSTGGCSAGESCNCKTQETPFCDTHIDVIPAKNTNHTDGRNVYVVEITQRIRILAKQGLVTSNLGSNTWSTGVLKSKLEGHRVRFSGFLYFDTDHATEAWVSDPADIIGGDNWRQTAWEVHPVMRIQVLN
jgi:hypothetical protein